MAIDRFNGKYRFLSNFYPCAVKLDGVLYPSVEHAYQAAKCASLEDRQKILSCKTPGEAKRLVRTLKSNGDIAIVKLVVMNSLLKQKFNKEPFRTWLLATGNEELIEGNTWGDVFWGVCDGKGENNLGRLLMRIREELSSNGKDACFSSR